MSQGSAIPKWVTCILGTVSFKIRGKVVSLLPSAPGKQEVRLKAECEEAFQTLKSHLRTLPPLAKQVSGDTLCQYLSINDVVISSVLLKDEDRN